MARYLRITDETDPAELREAIGHLRTKQRLCRDRQVYLELAEDIDSLVELVVQRERLARL